MRTILLSAVNQLIPALALLTPIGSVLYHAVAFTQPTPPEIIALMAGAFAAVIVAVAFLHFKVHHHTPFSGDLS